MGVETLTFPSADSRPMEAWLARPAAPGPHPAVLVVHEVYGLVDNLRAILDRFADEGFVAFAPNLYDKRAPQAICVTRSLLAMQRGKGPAVRDLHAALDFLCTVPDVDAERLAVTGFCMGGGFALLMALDSRVGAAAPFYGMSDAYLSEVARSCPIVASYGDKDRVFRTPAKKLKRRLVELEIAHDHKVYPDAGHSFMTRPRGTWSERLSAHGPMKVGYNADAAEDAWTRILAFFRTHVV